MKKLIELIVLLVALVGAQTAVAEYLVKRSGTVILVKTSPGVCWVADWANVAAIIPEEWASLRPIVIAGYDRLGRPLEPAERADCNDTTLPPKKIGWFVQATASGTRPVYTLMDGVLVRHSTAKAIQDEPCGDSATVILKPNQVKYRYIFLRDDMPTRPMGAISYCIELK